MHTGIPAIISYTKARNNFKAVMDKVWDDCVPVVVTRAGGKSVVILNTDDYDSMNETEYLTSSKANAKNLREALDYVNSGKPLVRMRFNKAGKLVRED